VDDCERCHRHARHCRLSLARPAPSVARLSYDVCGRSAYRVPSFLSRQQPPAPTRRSRGARSTDQVALPAGPALGQYGRWDGRTLGGRRASFSGWSPLQSGPVDAVKGRLPRAAVADELACRCYQTVCLPLPRHFTRCIASTPIYRARMVKHTLTMVSPTWRCFCKSDSPFHAFFVSCPHAHACLGGLHVYVSFHYADTRFFLRATAVPAGTPIAMGILSVCPSWCHDPVPNQAQVR